MEKKWRRIGKGETIPTSSIIRPINGGLPNITGSRVMMGQDCYYLSVDDAYELLKGLPLETEAETKERNDATIIKKLIGLVKETDFLSVENRASLLDWLEKQGEQKPCMIQWKGDNLKEVIDFTGKDKNFEKWFKSFEEYEKYVGEHNGIFKLFNEDGSHYEVPVGAWIVKTPDGRNVASKAVFKQKPADKVEPKFREGDWIINKSFGDVKQIKEFGNDEMVWFTDGTGTFVEFLKGYRLWTIQDAKDGDVLATLNYILIFKERLPKDGGVSYCHYDFGADNPRFIYTEDNNWYFGKEAIVYPAAKEQRDQLKKAMADAGYTFDFEKKELKKIEQEPTWSEEEKKKLDRIYYILGIAADEHAYSNTCRLIGDKEAIELQDFLRSIAKPEQKSAWSEEDEDMLLKQSHW